MPHIPRFPPGTPRVFGRIDRFTVECPRCGQLIQAHYNRTGGKIRRSLAQTKNQLHNLRRRQQRRQPLTYNPLTSRLICPQCRREFGVGLVLWTVNPRRAASQPWDQRPTYIELLAIRQLAGAFLLDIPVSGNDSLNLVIDESCTCTIDGSSGQLIVCYAPDCAVHGWQATHPPTDEPEPPKG